VSLVQNLAQWISVLETNVPAALKVLQINLQKKMDGCVESDSTVESTLLDNVKLPENLYIWGFDLTDVDIGELARQITMWSTVYYYSIGPRELLDCAWSKCSLRHRAPNITALTAKFNALGDWVVYQVLHATTVSRRLELLVFFMKLAQELWRIKNYFDGLAIAGGLNSTPIYRLKLHKRLVKAVHGSDGFKALEEILEASKSDSNFANLLNLQNEAQKAGAALPYIGVYLTQLTFGYDGNPDFIDGKVNFSKCVTLFKVIETVLSFRTKQFKFVVIDQIQEKLKQLKRVGESDMFAKSLQIEPRKMEMEFLMNIYKKEIQEIKKRSGSL
jgi:glycine hydroxymethyltransferase/Rap guanine nucleotide exchange factor 1